MREIFFPARLPAFFPENFFVARFTCHLRSNHLYHESAALKTEVFAICPLVFAF